MSRKSVGAVRMIAGARTLEEALWKQKPGLAGRTHWKQQWVRVDQTSLYVWSSALKPKNAEKAKHVFYLGSCKIAAIDSRKFGFCLTDTRTGHLIMLATDDDASFRIWFDSIRVLTNMDLVDVPEEEETQEEKDAKRMARIENARQRVLLEREEELQGADLEQIERSLEQAGLGARMGGLTSPRRIEKVESTQLAQTCADYFREHDVVGSSDHPCIFASALPALLYLLDGTLNPDVLVQLITKDLAINPGGLVGFGDFGDWWNSNQALTQTSPHASLISAERGLGEEDRGVEALTAAGGVETDEAVHLVGVGGVGGVGGGRSPHLARLRLPRAALASEVTHTARVWGAGLAVESICSSFTVAEVGLVGDWNDLYQTQLEDAALRNRQVLLMATEGRFVAPEGDEGEEGEE
ncbi:hypothetical protein B484DRAFT_283101, partial [Ochromonadaceae sp. CCMP2298]